MYNSENCNDKIQLVGINRGSLQVTVLQLFLRAWCFKLFNYKMKHRFLYLLDFILVFIGSGTLIFSFHAYCYYII